MYFSDNFQLRDKIEGRCALFVGSNLSAEWSCYPSSEDYCVWGERHKLGIALSSFRLFFFKHLSDYCVLGERHKLLMHKGQLKKHPVGMALNSWLFSDYWVFRWKTQTRNGFWFFVWLFSYHLLHYYVWGENKLGIALNSLLDYFLGLLCLRWRA